MSDQISLPFVTLVGPAASAPPEAFPEVRRTRRNPARSRPLKVAARTAEAPPLANAADDSSSLDVHDYLVRRDDASFIFEARGDAMNGAGIFEGDMLIIDKRIQPAHGHIVLACVNGERLVRRLHHRGHKTSLLSESPEVPEIKLEAGSELSIWGVIVGSFKRFWA